MKKVISIILALISVFIIKITAFATEDFEAEISDKLFSSLDNDIVEALDEFGINGLDYESIYNISFQNVFSYYKDSFENLLTGGLKMFLKLLSMVMLVGFVTMILESEQYKTLLSALSVMAVTVLIVDDINLCLSSAVSLIKLNGSFMVSFVPIYALIIAVSGNPSSAVTYNTLVLGFAEGISAVINYGLIDLLGCFFCLSIAFSINDSLNFGRLISVTNRVITFVLGLVSSVFASLLTLKGFVSAAADSVTSKGIKFAIGSLIPVIGSSISEAYSVLLGSINVIKGSVAIIGIVVILIINLPVVFEIMVYYFSLSSLSFVCDMLDCRELSNAFKGFSCGVKIIGLLAVFEMFILIISTAVMLSFKGG